MNDVSGTGLSLRIIASHTFPVGFVCTAFADDTDPLDFPEQTVTEFGMGLNGDLITWSTPKPLEVTISVIPGTGEENNLALLLESNRVAKNKKSARDTITFVASYPDGSKKTLRPGKIVAGPTGNSVASGGRIKTGQYRFVFENKL